MRDLPYILNWRRLTERITSSVQPTEEQFADLKKLGVTHVINLGPHHNKGALEDEPGTLSKLGLDYIYIPVEFDDPTDQNFEAFCDALEGLPATQVHAHCIYNARVSAFFYRYAKSGRGLSEADAFSLMDGIWRPGNDWAQFIGSEAAVGQPNRYAGEDY